MTLGQVAKLFKSELTLIILAITSFSMIGFVLFSYFTKDETAQISSGIPWKGNIYPGSTTADELGSSLGQPTQVTEENGKIVYSYPSEVQTRPHSVYINENKIEIIKEQVTSQNKRNLSEFTRQYGSFDTKIYGYHGSFAPGYFWQQEGLLVFAGEFDGNVVEIWYFKPTDINSLLASYPELKLDDGEGF